MSVLVLGATGNIGPHVVRELVALGESPRVLVRDGDRARAMLGAAGAVDVRAGDMTDPATLDAAADGVDTVFLLSPHGFRMADAQLAVIRELRRTGIRIVKISATSSAVNPDGPHACRQHWEVERVLVESGQPYVILRPNAFMQVIVGQQLLPALASTGRILNPIGDAGLSFVDARDVGAVAAQVITRHDWDGQTLALTGPRAVTYPEIAELAAARTGTPTTVVDVSIADLRASLVGRGLADWEADHFAEMYGLFKSGESSFVTDTIEQVTGRPARTIEAYLDEALAPTGAGA
jgi:uncharacterized protein YbjT (DUF2867 family)